MLEEQQALRVSGRPQTEAEASAKLDAVTSKYSNAQVDRKGRVLVRVYLDGVKPVKRMAVRLKKKGLKVLSQLDTYRAGVISAWMPIEAATKVAAMSGVRAVQMALRPYYRVVHPVGQVTSQGQTVLHADAVLDMGYDGTGIKIGALSDTFDLYPAGQDPSGVPDIAAYDVTRGDLPVVEDVADYAIGMPTDEGRGMLQIAHDIAPGASLAFATAEGTEIEFAQNITILGSPTSVTSRPRRTRKRVRSLPAPGSAVRSCATMSVIWTNHVLRRHRRPGDRLRGDEVRRHLLLQRRQRRQLRVQRHDSTRRRHAHARRARRLPAPRA